MARQTEPSGWWQASDGKWYPPESHPTASSRQRSSPAPPGADRHYEPVLYDRLRSNEVRPRVSYWQWVAGGALVAFVGFFLPWAHIFLLGSLDFPDMLSLVAQQSKQAADVWRGMALAVVVLLVILGSSFRRSHSRVLGAVVLLIALAAAAVFGLWGFDINRLTSHFGHSLVSVGVGPYVTVIGFAVAVLGAIRYLVSITRSKRPIYAIAAGRAPGWYPMPDRPGYEQWWNGEFWTTFARPRA